MRACAQLLVKVCACRTKTLAKINCQNQSHATVHALSLACEKAASAAQTRQGRTQSRAALGHIQIQHRSGCAHLAHHTYKAGLGCHSVVVRSTKLGWTLFSTTHACALPLLFRSRIRFTATQSTSRFPLRSIHKSTTLRHGASVVPRPSPGRLQGRRRAEAAQLALDLAPQRGPPRSRLLLVLAGRGGRLLLVPDVPQREACAPQGLLQQALRRQRQHLRQRGTGVAQRLPRTGRLGGLAAGRHQEGGKPYCRGPGCAAPWPAPTLTVRASVTGSPPCPHWRFAARRQAGRVRCTRAPAHAPTPAGPCSGACDTLDS